MPVKWCLVDHQDNRSANDCWPVKKERFQLKGIQFHVVVLPKPFSGAVIRRRIEDRFMCNVTKISNVSNGGKSETLRDWENTFFRHAMGDSGLELNMRIFIEHDKQVCFVSFRQFSVLLVFTGTCIK